MGIIWLDKIYKCTANRSSGIGNQYFTNPYKYVIT